MRRRLRHRLRPRRKICVQSCRGAGAGERVEEGARCRYGGTIGFYVAVRHQKPASTRCFTVKCDVGCVFSLCSRLSTYFARMSVSMLMASLTDMEWTLVCA